VLSLMRTLQSMIGEVIIARIPLLDADGMMLLKLHGVETNGIWVESQDFTNEAHGEVSTSSALVTTPLVFLPFDKSISLLLLWIHFRCQNGRLEFNRRAAIPNQLNHGKEHLTNERENKKY